jgi:ParB-like nuclease domain
MPEPLDVFALPVHPAADEFPMLPDDELQELADSIKANGLRQPLVVAKVKSGDGADELMLIDGRNRREACRRANIAPGIIELNGGADPLAYILDLNAHRRHLSKGQLAMAVARVCLETKQPMREAAKASSLTAGRIAQASTVIRFAPERVEQVRAGTFKLDAAYAEALQRKRAKEMFDARVTRNLSLREGSWRWLSRRSDLSRRWGAGLTTRKSQLSWEFPRARA